MELGQLTFRAVEPSDLDFLLLIENDPNNWEVSNTRVPFSRNTLESYLGSVQDIYVDKQLRLVLELDKTPCGIVDLFEFDAFHRRAGVGIVISPEYRNKGIALHALDMLKEYCYRNLDLRLLFCNILRNNAESIRLFEKASFFYAGSKKDWHRAANGEFVDELMYQFNF